MTLEEYIYYPALSASRIKAYYAGDISRVYKALDAGNSFHKRLLETPPKHMDVEAYGVYKAIISTPAWERIWNESKKEYAQVKTLVIAGQAIPVKVKHDIWHKSLIADIKTTSCKSREDFASDMIAHYNHIQAVLFSMAAGIDPSRFIYIGVTQKARRGIVKPEEIYFHSHTPEELAQGLNLIENYIITQWESTSQYLNQRQRTSAQ